MASGPFLKGLTTSTGMCSFLHGVRMEGQLLIYSPGIVSRAFISVLSNLWFPWAGHCYQGFNQIWCQEFRTSLDRGEPVHTAVGLMMINSPHDRTCGGGNPCSLPLPTENSIYSLPTSVYVLP